MINIVLYQPEIPSNTGNIIRTCCATGANLHLIKPIGFDLEHPEFKRAAMDYLNIVTIFTYDSYDDFYNQNKVENLFLISRYGSKSADEFNFSNYHVDYYFLFGKESSGLPSELLNKYPQSLIRIPMKMSARSLNLANCVSIIIYEALRQQKYYSLSKIDFFKL